jgi:predicted permease
MSWFDIFRRRRFERDLNDELMFDVECRTEANVRAGMSPTEARRQALISLGGVAQTKEQCRDGHPLAWLETVLQDLRFGAHVLRCNPGVTAIAVLSLAAGIGANSAIFGAIDAVATRPMPIADASRIIHISTTSPTSNYPAVSGADYLDYRHTRSLIDVAAVDYRGPVLTIGDSPETTYAEVVSDNFFTLLGVEAAVGRTFRDEPHAPPAIVLGHRFFVGRFGGDPHVIGRVIRMGSTPVTIVGVAPASFQGTRPWISADLWVPFSTWGEPESLQNRRVPVFRLFGRLRPGVTVAQAEQELATMTSNLARAYPATNAGRTVLVESDRTHRMRAAGNLGVILMALVIAVLLLASMNVAILLLARAETRRREMAVRLALGAGRLRLMRQLLTEASLLAGLGAVAGILLGSILIQIVPATLQLNRLLGAIDFKVDARVLVFSLAVSVGSGIAFGLVPALAAARADVAPALKTTATAAGTSAGRARVRNVLVACQVALSLVLVVTSILLAMSFGRALEADLGFTRDNVLVLSIPSQGRVGSERRDLLYREVVASVRSMPGVRGAAVAMRPPMGTSGGGRSEKILLPGPRPEPQQVRMTVVGPGYFSLLHTQITRGREFDDRDDSAAKRVAIINETGARRLWPTESPIGKTFRSAAANGPTWEIVGVSRDVPVTRVGETPRPYLYFPFAQKNSSDLTLLVATASSPTALVAPIRERLTQIDKSLVIYSSSTLDSLVDLAFEEYRLPSVLALVLAAIGVLLAAVGLYGVIAYFVSARTHETGIRLALGARPADVLRSVLVHAVRLAGCGIALGLALALAAGRGLSSLLYGVSPRDWSALAGASVLMLLVALAASYVPARRATRTDPVATLSQE